MKVFRKLLVFYIICISVILIMIVKIIAFIYHDLEYIHEGTDNNRNDIRNSNGDRDQQISVLLPGSGHTSSRIRTGNNNRSAAAVYNYNTMKIYNETELSSTHLHFHQVKVPNTWIRITDNLFVYSAYLESRESKSTLKNSAPFIRIIALWKIPRDQLRKEPLGWRFIKDEAYFGRQFYGKIFYKSQSNDPNSESQMANVSCSATFTRKIFEEGLKFYAGTFIKCRPAENIFDTSKFMSSHSFVAIYPTDIFVYPTKLIPIRNVVTPVETRRQQNLTICVRPLFGPFDNLLQLVQFLAFYESFGVTQFVFYDLAISYRIRSYLNSFSGTTAGPNSTGTLSIELHQWNLPTGNWNELWDYGSLTALNDCLYRHMYSSEYIMFIDIDEYIVPQMQQQRRRPVLGDKILDLAHSVELGRNNKRFGQYLYRNTFFCSEFCNERQGRNSLKDMSKSVDVDLLPVFNPAVNCHLRTKKAWRVEFRSKYIVSPLLVEQVGHHRVTKFWKDNFDPRFIKISNQSQPVPKNYTALATEDAANTYEFSPNVVLMNHYRRCAPISTRSQPILNRTTVLDDKINYFKDRIKETMSFRLYKSVVN